MSQKTVRTVAKVIALLLVGALVITSFTFVFSWADSPAPVYAANPSNDEGIDWEKELSQIERLIQIVQADYLDDVSVRSLIDGAYKGILDSLDDPYSVYYDSEEESQEFEESVSGEFSGVGVSLEQVGNITKVVAPISGGPAEEAGVLSGDVVINVDGADVSAMNVTQIANMLRGKEGSKVDMTVKRNERTLTFYLIREKIKLASVSFELLPRDIGYIKISQFDNDSHLEFKAARLKLAADGAKSFIVDVRNNPGGYVGTAADVAEQLMPEGPIVHFLKQGEIVETISAGGRSGPEYPVVLLVNAGSASSSEILAAAWKDSGTAKIVGTQTYGKGLAQQIFTVADGKKVKLSMYYFVSPKKNPINKVGVTPDYVVKNHVAFDEEEATKLYNEYKLFAPMSDKSKPKRGDAGLNVFGAQQRLSLIGYKVMVSGTMDDSTVESVKAFQKGEGLFPYGVLDYSTMDKLDKAVLEYINGAGNRKDLQLEKAVELLMSS